MNKLNGSRYLIAALGGGVALLCLALGFQLLGPDLPADLGPWLEDGRVRNGLILTLGGSVLSFLLGSGFVVGARKTLEFTHHLGTRKPSHQNDPLESMLRKAGKRLSVTGQELANLAVNPDQEPDSLECLNQTVAQLRDTVQQTEDIVNSINEIGGFPEKPQD